MRFMIWANAWRLTVLVVMSAVFSRIDIITPFSKGDIVKGTALATVSIVLWVMMMAWMSWIRNDAVRKAIEEEEN